MHVIRTGADEKGGVGGGGGCLVGGGLYPLPLVPFTVYLKLAI